MLKSRDLCDFIKRLHKSFLNLKVFFFQNFDSKQICYQQHKFLSDAVNNAKNSNGEISDEGPSDQLEHDEYGLTDIESANESANEGGDYYYDYD